MQHHEMRPGNLEQRGKRVNSIGVTTSRPRWILRFLPPHFLDSLADQQSVLPCTLRHVLCDSVAEIRSTVVGGQSSPHGLTTLNMDSGGAW